MASILGLLSTEDFGTQRFKNYRRSVFYQYPQGAAPLNGVLSLLDEENTDDPEFNWFEKRLRDQRTTTASHSASKGPFADSSDTILAAAATITSGTEYIVKVAASEQFRVGHAIKIKVDRDSQASTDEVHGVVVALTSSTKLKFRATKTVTLIDNNITNENVGKECLIVGSAFAQGSLDITTQPYNLPTQYTNYCQIFRTPFSLTGTALKTQAKYDESGPYKDKAKEHSVYHMVEMEKAMIFGQQAAFVDGSTGLPTYGMGGIYWHLQQWEAGTAYGVSASTADSDDNKRIIENASGSISERAYDGYLERLFRVTNNKTNEKLVLCGSGFLQTINSMYRSKSVLNADLPMTETYGMDIVKHRTSFGTVLYKTHPLFSQNPDLRFSALFLDVHNIKYRYVEGRDTELLKNRQAPDADYRKDEYLSECGIEVRFPESHMFMKNVQNYTP